MANIIIADDRKIASDAKDISILEHQRLHAGARQSAWSLPDRMKLGLNAYQARMYACEFEIF